METYERIWKFETAHFIVECAIAPDYDLDLSFDDDGSICDDLNNGNLIAFAARVRLRVKGYGIILAEDYLGGCIYRNADDFRNGGGYFHDMVRTVLQDGRQQMIKTLNALKAIHLVNERIAV